MEFRNTGRTYKRIVLLDDSQPITEENPDPANFIWFCNLCDQSLKEDVGIVCCVGCKTLYCAKCLPENAKKCKFCGKGRGFVKTILSTGNESDEEADVIEVRNEVEALERTERDTREKLHGMTAAFKDKRLHLEHLLAALGKQVELGCMKIEQSKQEIENVNQTAKKSKFAREERATEERNGRLDNLGYIDTSMKVEQELVTLRRGRASRESEQYDLRDMLKVVKEDVFRDEEALALKKLLVNLPKRPCNQMDNDLDEDEGLAPPRELTPKMTVTAALTLDIADGSELFENKKK